MLPSTAEPQSSKLPHVLLTRGLTPKAQEYIESRQDIRLTVWREDRPIPRDVLLEKVRGVDGVLCMLTDRIDQELLSHAGPNLKVVSTMSVGYDHIDVGACKSRGVLVGNTPDVLTDATADLTIGLILALTRRLIEGVHIAKIGKWGNWSPTWLCGTGLKSKTIGIIGMGRIGIAVAERLKAFGVGDILYTATKEKTGLSFKAHFATLESVLSRSDIVIITCALSSSTKYLLNETTFALMRPTALLVNTARGPIVHTPSLIKALQDGVIFGAALDVTDPEPLSPDSPLFTMSNCIILPHLGSATIETREDMAHLAVENVLRGVRGEALMAQVQ